MADSSAGTPTPRPEGRRGPLFVLALAVVFVMILVLARCVGSGGGPTSASSTGPATATATQSSEGSASRATATESGGGSPPAATPATSRPDAPADATTGAPSAPPTKGPSSAPSTVSTEPKPPDTVYLQVIMTTKFEVSVTNDRNAERCSRELDAVPSPEHAWCTLSLPAGDSVRLTGVLSGTPSGVVNREPEREPAWYGCQEGDGSPTCTLDLTGGHWVCLASHDVSEPSESLCEGYRDSGLLAPVPPGSSAPPSGARPPGS
ncbi:hypothetical protein GCM10009579_86410 [Streptomyces javensis]|uniref:Uncharacterized protein n=1 Tax=Streptomyces javensis TaxID=114698 RepID=A0ABP4I1N5_9ACTN